MENGVMTVGDCRDYAPDGKVARLARYRPVRVLSSRSPGSGAFPTGGTVVIPFPAARIGRRPSRWF